MGGWEEEVGEGEWLLEQPFITILLKWPISGLGLVLISFAKGKKVEEEEGGGT